MIEPLEPFNKTVNFLVVCVKQQFNAGNPNSLLALLSLIIHIEANFWNNWKMFCNKLLQSLQSRNILFWILDTPIFYLMNQLESFLKNDFKKRDQYKISFRWFYLSMSFFVFFHRNQKYCFGCKQDISDLKFCRNWCTILIIYIKTHAKDAWSRFFF